MSRFAPRTGAMNLPILNQPVPTDRPVKHWQTSLWRLAGVVYCGIICADGHCQQLDRQAADIQRISSNRIAQLFTQLNRNSRWHLIHEQPLSFPTYHAQGLTRAHGKYFLSTVQVRDKSSSGQDISDSENDNSSPGTGHLIVFGDLGEKMQSIQLGEAALFHPGGIDRDDLYIWIPVAEYRPNSRTIIYRVRISDLHVEEVLRLDDHIGAVICDWQQQRLIGMSWGARRIYIWPLDDHRLVSVDPKQAISAPLLNPQQFIDYQDCQYIGDGFAVCSGLANYNRGSSEVRFSLGGIDLWDLRQLRPLHLLPVTVQTDKTPRRVMTQNPFYVELREDGLRFHFIPEDEPSTYYVYEVQAR